MLEQELSDAIFMNRLVERIWFSTGKREYCVYILTQGDGGAKFPAHQHLMDTHLECRNIIRPLH